MLTSGFDAPVHASESRVSARARRESRRAAYWAAQTARARERGAAALLSVAASRLQSAVSRLPDDRRDAVLAEAERALHDIRLRYSQ